MTFSTNDSKNGSTKQSTASRHYPHTDGLALAVEHTPAKDSANAPHVMFCGGFHSAMAGAKATALQALCETKGWHYTRFDYRGHGQSNGEPASFTLTDWLDDTLAVLEDSAHSTVLVGSSMGAWLATLAALRKPQKVQALILLAAAPDFLQRRVAPQLTPSQIWDLQQGQVIELPNAYDSSYPITQALLDSGNALSLLEGKAMEELQCPIRLIHGTADEHVPFDLSTGLMAKLTSAHDARLTLLHNADHRLSDEQSLSYIELELTQLIAQLDPAN